MLFIWLGGGLLLYGDLQYPVGIVAEYMKSGSQPEGVDTLAWVLMFARPLFVFGVMCAVAMPRLGGRKKTRKKQVEAPAKPSS
jgi:hypothetical protein